MDQSSDNPSPAELPAPGAGGTPAPQEAPARPSRRWLIAAGIAVLTGVVLAGMAWGYYRYYPDQIGPEQPIHFSHRVHATDKGISCLMCHTHAVDTDRSGVPPLETCMMCHSRIITTHPEIVALREHYESGKPVEWVRVGDLPDFAHFSHRMHVRRGFDCSRCHGDVASMDRVKAQQSFQMGFCVQCHRDNQQSVDCFLCHY